MILRFLAFEGGLFPSLDFVFWRGEGCGYVFAGGNKQVCCVLAAIIWGVLRALHS